MAAPGIHLANFFLSTVEIIALKSQYYGLRVARVSGTYADPQQVCTICVEVPKSCYYCSC